VKACLRLILGDLAFIYDIKDRKFYCFVGEDCREYGEADLAEGPKEEIREEGIYYFSTDRRDKFSEKPELYMVQASAS